MAFRTTGSNTIVFLVGYTNHLRGDGHRVLHRVYEQSINELKGITYTRWACSNGSNDVTTFEATRVGKYELDIPDEYRGKFDGPCKGCFRVGG